MYDQFIPIQSVNRSALEYNLKYYGADEFHIPPPMVDPGLSGLRELPFHYQPVALPKPYSFSLTDAVVCGREIIAMDNPNRVFLETYAEVTLFREGSNYTSDRVSRKRAFRYGKVADCDFETAYFFSTTADSNYFHFLIDSCLRYVDLEEEGIISPETKILFDTEPNHWQLEYLSLLNISKDRIVLHKHQVQRRWMTKVKNLVISSSRRQRFAVSQMAIASLNKRIHANLNVKEAQSPKRILISRAYAGSRKIENENELAAALMPHGFEVVHLEKMSVSEQIRIFATAECIVGPHGAGLANIIYSKSPLVIELIPHDWWGWGYFIPLTHAVGGTHRAVVGTQKDYFEKTQRDYFMKEFLVDIAAVMRALSDLLP